MRVRRRVSISRKHHRTARFAVVRRSRGLNRIAVRDDKGKPATAQVELSYRRMTVRPPIGKQKRYSSLVLTLLHAREPHEPVGRPRID